MKRLTWLFSILAVLAVVAAIAPPPAQAACAPGSGVQMGSAFPTSTYTYAPVPASINTAGAFRLGRFWEPAKRAAAIAAGQDEGGCAANATCGGSSGGAEWWTQFPTFPWYINAQLDIPLVDGCPGVPGDGDLTPPDEVLVALLDRDDPPPPNGGNAYYYAARTAFHAADFPEFDMSQGGATCSAPWAMFNMPPIPKLTNIVSSRVDFNTVALDFCLADVAAGFQGRSANCSPIANPYASISAYRLCQVELGADPGRLAGAWSCAPLAPTAAGGFCTTNFQVDCADTTPPITDDKFLAIQLVYDGGAYLTEYVGASVRVECDPNLAQPEPTRRAEPRLNRQQPPTKGTRRP